MAFLNKVIIFKRSIFIISISLCLFCANPNKVDTMYFTDNADTIDISLDNYKKESEGMVIDYDGWNPILIHVFQKLAPGSKILVTILKKNSFNMVFFPENNFIVHTETLDILDKELTKLKSEVSSLKSCSDRNSCRELMIAPIIAHELAHYFQEDHKNLKLKLAQYSNLPAIEKSNQILSFKREREFAADTFAASLLSKHHYNAELVLVPILILKKINQSRNKNPNDRIDYYLKSHPSPNERFANLDKKESYHNLEELEKAFHFVATGKNKDTLKYALNLIERQLINFPENLELKRARATAMHRYWMYTATPSELKFVAIIDQPLFSDSEEFNTKKGVKKIPGDENIYKKALSLYDDLYEKVKFIDYGFISNYAVLLAYSDSEDNKKKSLSLALDAFQNTKTFKTLNNLGIVYGLQNEFIEGLQAFWYEIPQSDRKNIELNQFGKSIHLNSKEDTSFPFNEQFVNNEKELIEKIRWISLFNYTITKFYSGEKENYLEADKLKKKYFYAGDNPSAWVQYLNNDFAHNK